MITAAAQAQVPQHDDEEQEREAFLASLDESVPVFSDALTDRSQLDTFLDRYLEALAERERTIAENRLVADARKAMIDRWLQSEK